MSDVDVGDGSVTSDPSFDGGVDGGLHINQTVNQAQDQSNTQQQQQQQGPVPVFSPIGASQAQFLNTPAILIPADSHAQASVLLAQLQSLLGL